MTDRHLDGNAAAGMLSAALGVEATLVRVTCDSCGNGALLATLMTYQTPLGAALYCPACGALLLRAAEVRGRLWLDARGARSLQFGPT